MGEIYKSTHKYTSHERHILNFEANCLFSVLSKNQDGWWLVRDELGREGLVPSTYLVKHLEPPVKKSGEGIYEVVHTFMSNQPRQLSVIPGDKLYLKSKINDVWWEMRTPQGKQGLVPAKYVRSWTVQEPARSKSPSSENPTDDVLQSIDTAIQRIYDEAAANNGMMNEQQRKTLVTLTQHRQTMIRTKVTQPVVPTEEETKRKPTRKAPPPPASKENTPDPDETDGRDEAPKIVKSEEPMEEGRKEPTLEELEVPESTPLADIPPVPPSLPLSFDVGVGVRLVNAVRSLTGISFSQSISAAEATLRFVGTEVPALSDTMDALIVALAASKISEDTDLKVASSDDLERLLYLFDKIRECRDDRQERSWAVRDDQGTIMDYLEEILKLLSDADPSVSKAAVADSNYETVLVLVEYYQMELRWPIRLLLLQLFGVLFSLDNNIVSVCLSGVLPNVLGKDIQESKDDLKNLLHVSLVCTMLFSTGEIPPLSVYDQWSTDFITEVLEMIEDPPSCDTDDQVPDALVNVVLSFNQHFTDPDQNTVMDALKDNPNRKAFSEKLMLLINREEDPVCLKEPLVPDSMIKFCLDLFSSKITAGMLYTSDLKVLIDIITRQLSDRAPGDQLRTHYLSLLHKLIGSTDYGESLHRRDELTACLSRIFSEEEEVKEDKKIVNQIWKDFPQCFQFVSSI